MDVVSRRIIKKFLELARAEGEPAPERFTFGSTTVTVETTPIKRLTNIYLSHHGVAVSRVRWTSPSLPHPPYFFFTAAGYHTQAAERLINVLLWRIHSGCRLYIEDGRACIHYQTVDREGRAAVGEAYLDASRWYTLVYADGTGDYVLAWESLDPQTREHIVRTHNECQPAGTVG